FERHSHATSESNQIPTRRPSSGPATPRRLANGHRPLRCSRSLSLANRSSWGSSGVRGACRPAGGGTHCSLGPVRYELRRPPACRRRAVTRTPVIGSVSPGPVARKGPAVAKATLLSHLQRLERLAQLVVVAFRIGASELDELGGKCAVEQQV